MSASSPGVVCSDFSSLYPQVMPVYGASLVPKSIITSNPMSKPTGMLHYMDFDYVPSWVEKYKHIPGAIKIKIKDTFNNVLDFFENPGIVVAEIMNVEIDVQFIDALKFGQMSNLLKNYMDDVGGGIDKLKSKYDKMFGRAYQFGKEDDVKDPIIKRESLIDIDLIVYAPYNKYVKMNSISNYDRWKSHDTVETFTCKEFIQKVSFKK